MIDGNVSLGFEEPNGVFVTQQYSLVSERMGKSFIFREG